MTPVGMAMLFHVFPPAERVRASAVLIIPTALAPALGPVLGGIFVDDVTWRWVFFVNVPIGAIAVIFGGVFLADTRHGTAGRFDVVGFILAGVSLGSLMYGLSEGPSKGWSEPTVVTTCIVGAVLLVAMVLFELRVDDPMLDLRLYTNRLFCASLSVITLMSLGFFGVIYLLALFYQYGLGLSAINSGLNVFPEAIGVMISSQLVTRQLYPRCGPRRIMCAGSTIAAVMMALLCLVGPSTSLWVVRAIMLVLGFGLAGIFIPVQAAAFAKISLPKIGRASTLFNTQQRIGSAIGVAIVATVAAAIGPTHIVHGQVEPHLIAYRIAFLVAAGLTLLAAIAALLVNDADAAETMVRRPKKSAPGGESIAAQDVPVTG
jgi:EmrB/QacA subfamily drug resistance transporter